MSGAGGGSGDGESGNSSVGQLTISGGNVFGYGSNGAGIGSGYAYRGNSTVEVVRITGGVLNGTGFSGAGIGAGYGFSGNATVGSVYISGANVIADGLTEGAGIGSGYAFTGTSYVGSITIADAQVTASGTRAAGIGAGNGLRGNATVGQISIINGCIVSTGVNAAGIGAGMTDGGDASVVDVTVQNGTIVARGAVGLGSSPTAFVGAVRLGGASGSVMSFECHSASEWCIDGQSVSLSNVALSGATNARQFIASGKDTGEFTDVSITGLYVKPSIADSFGSVVRIHAGQVWGLGLDVWHMVIRSRESVVASFEFNTSQFSGFIVTVPESEEYQIAVHNTLLCRGAEDTFHVAAGGEVYLDELKRCGSPLPSWAIAVLVVGIIGLVAFTAILGRCCWKRYRHRVPCFGDREGRYQIDSGVDLIIDNMEPDAIV
jgi:hypothetical protein